MKSWVLNDRVRNAGRPTSEIKNDVCHAEGRYFIFAHAQRWFLLGKNVSGQINLLLNVEEDSRAEKNFYLTPHR